MAGLGPIGGISIGGYFVVGIGIRAKATLSDYALWNASLSDSKVFRASLSDMLVFTATLSENAV